jgi:DNA-dependent RNA polymerase auxiliary subunit epsilon
MLFKIFYQEDKDSTPRRESTQTMYLEIPAKTELEGAIKVRELIAKKTNYRIEFIDALSKEAEKLEKKNKHYELTTL